MRIVSNTTPISELYKIGHLDLLQIVYTHIVIPEAVMHELQQAQTLPDLHCAIKQMTWIEVRTINNPHNIQELQNRHPYIDTGEVSAIVLAQEWDANRILIDDRRARRVAGQEGLSIIGTVGVVLLAHRLGRITAQQARTILDKLYEGTAYISEDLYRDACQQLQEQRQ